MGIWLRPQTLAEALAALASDAASPPADSMGRLSIIAGATDFLPAATTRQAWFQPVPRNVLDISAIASLRGIATADGGVVIGAMATWTDLLAASLPPAFDALRQAARQVGGVQIQNRGTIAGNLCNASPAADGVPPLLALDAEVEIASLAEASGERVTTRRLPLGQFILGNRRTALRPGELVTAIGIPSPLSAERGAFQKLGARSYLVISIASVAVNMALDDAGRIARARIAVGACSAVPQRLTALEARLAGERSEQAARAVESSMLAALDPIDDVRASAAYRRDAALTLVRRALEGFAEPREQAA